ncbi:hypothetical protein SAE01_40360 [Segetibacter aerophilus]|uniref:Uncharacterized protein n=1 Tax=Segetibacter aerophilus TaxID=670293 RepID=A0A512BHW2_9BACT|nr:hypothetical protein SAE01_40360 [Segetibacter aerophilus]
MKNGDREATTIEVTRKSLVKRSENNEWASFTQPTHIKETPKVSAPKIHAPTKLHMVIKIF